ncbi:unnamed protein product, partial [Allacma fusca]
ITLFAENVSIQGALAKNVTAMTKNMTVDPYLRKSNRNKRKKLFFDEDPDITCYEEMRRRLCNHIAPPQNIFDYLTKTLSVRRKDILKCRADLDFEQFLSKWPRLLDATEAVKKENR